MPTVHNLAEQLIRNFNTYIYDYGYRKKKKRQNTREIIIGTCEL